MEEGRADWLSFLRSRLSPAFEVRVTAVAPGRERTYHEADWRDALVVVDRGSVELESLDGSRERFARDDVLWLEGLPLRALHNCGGEPAVLLAISRPRRSGRRLRRGQGPAPVAEPR